MGISIPWSLQWTPKTLRGTHPTLPSWSIDRWQGDPDDILKAVLNTFLLQMMDDQPINVEQASHHHLDGWVLSVPIPPYQRHRCELWDALWRVRVLEHVPEDVLCEAIGVHDVHDIVTRLSPIRHVETWLSWHHQVYRVLETTPWD